MTLAWTLLGGWLAAALLMTALWLIQRARGNAAIVDVGWTFATAVLGTTFALSADGASSRRAIVAACVLVWGTRLALHLWARVRREPEDGRYGALRAAWGVKTQRNLLLFFQLQAFWAVLFAAPMLAAAANPRPLGGLDALGVTFWLVSLSGASVADRQLAAFRADPRHRGQVCRAGLWRFSRHPNYFFEWLHWWAYACLAAGSPWWWVAMLGVAAMYLFLTRVTGIPPTEAQALRSRGDAYRAYQRSTSPFVPWPPREER